MSGTVSWTRDRVEKLKELAAEGLSIDELQHEFECSREVISKVTKRNGIAVKGLRRSTRPNIRWQGDQLQELKNFAQNHTAQEIADEYDLDIRTVYQTCKNHAVQFKPNPKPYEANLDSFWSNYVTDERTNCWLWTGKTQYSGYGIIRINKESRYELAHRLAWVLHNKQSIPEKLVIDHLCSVRRCINPSHLECITHAENVSRTSKRYLALRQVAWQVVDSPSEENLERLKKVLTT